MHSVLHRSCCSLREEGLAAHCKSPSRRISISTEPLYQDAAEFICFLDGMLSRFSTELWDVARCTNSLSILPAALPTLSSLLLKHHASVASHSEYCSPLVIYLATLNRTSESMLECTSAVCASRCGLSANVRDAKSLFATVKIFYQFHQVDRGRFALEGVEFQQSVSVFRDTTGEGTNIAAFPAQKKKLV